MLFYLAIVVWAMILWLGLGASLEDFRDGKPYAAAAGLVLTIFLSIAGTATLVVVLMHEMASNFLSNLNPLF